MNVLYQTSVQRTVGLVKSETLSEKMIREIYAVRYNRADFGLMKSLAITPVG